MSRAAGLRNGFYLGKCADTFLYQGENRSDENVAGLQFRHSNRGRDPLRQKGLGIDGRRQYYRAALGHRAAQRRLDTAYGASERRVGEPERAGSCKVNTTDAMRLGSAARPRLLVVPVGLWLA